MTSVAGKRIVITGSTRGLGRAFAERLAAAGASVVINGTNLDLLAEVENAIRSTGGKVASVAGSVAEEDTCEALVAGCEQAFGGIDVMIHNAGVVRDRTLLKMTMDEWDEVIAVHLRGAFALTRAAARAMKEDGGHIVLVVSNSGLSGGFGQANYAAAKAGMMGLLRTAVMELTRFGIRTNAMWPIAETDMTQVVFDRARAAAEEKGVPAPSAAEIGFGRPEEVAEGMLWLVSDAASHFNGQCVTFNGRKTALWSHPAEQHVHFSDHALDADELAALYAEVEPLPIFRPRMHADA